MITVLKETPITLDGEDCMEVLVNNDNIIDGTCCDLCIYNRWDYEIYHQCSCMDVHGCTWSPNTYFITRPL